MTIGRILGSNKDVGSGFALATSLAGSTRVVLTASHVIDHQETSAIQFAILSGRKIAVERVVRADDLDIAVLYLSEEVSGGLAKGQAVEEAAWKVETQPLGNDPMLKGTIDALRWRVVTKLGNEIPVLQLRVNEHLGDYKGYSGSAVMLDGPSSGVIGVLIIQLLSRFSGVIGQARPATNVLYAIPLQNVLDRFDLQGVPMAPLSEAGLSPNHTSGPVDQLLSMRVKLGKRRVEEQLNKLQARANALTRSLEGIIEQRNNGIIDGGRFMLMEKNLNQQRSEVLQEATRMLEGMDEDFDAILLSAVADEQEDVLMEDLAQIARKKGLARQIVSSLERQQGTSLFWLVEVGKQLMKLAK